MFVVLIVFAFQLSSQCPYAYGYSILSTPKLNDTQIAEQMIEDNFGSSNMVALVVPAGDFDKEREMLAEIESHEEVDYTMGLTNIEAMDGYMLADKLTPRQFAELAGLDYEVAEVVYAAYAANQENYGQLAGKLSTYQVPLIDMTFFYCFLAFSHCIAGIMRGAGKSTVPMFVMLASWCIIRITYITVTVHFIPKIQVIFWAYPLTWSISSAIFLYLFLRGKWVYGFEKGGKR